MRLSAIGGIKEVSYKVENAVIMAAGMSSRLAPLSNSKPKALLNVRGEVLIERQICQLRESGITEIILVVGYKKEQFYYLKEKYNVLIIENQEYSVRNNHSSIYAAKEHLGNSYICSADNYFTINPFEKEVDESYYATVFASEETDEWCVCTDENDYITYVQIGGYRQWYMFGHVFWDEKFSGEFIQILEKVYDKEETKHKLWEDIYRENLGRLKMKIKRYEKDQIYEFDTLADLCLFDKYYEGIYHANFYIS